MNLLDNFINELEEVEEKYKNERNLALGKFSEQFPSWLKENYKLFEWSNQWSIMKGVLGSLVVWITPNDFTLHYIEQGSLDKRVENNHLYSFLESRV